MITAALVFVEGREEIDAVKQFSYKHALFIAEPGKKMLIKTRPTAISRVLLDPGLCLNRCLEN